MSEASMKNICLYRACCLFRWKVWGKDLYPITYFGVSVRLLVRAQRFTGKSCEAVIWLKTFAIFPCRLLAIYHADVRRFFRCSTAHIPSLLIAPEYIYINDFQIPNIAYSESVGLTARAALICIYFAVSVRPSVAVNFLLEIATKV
jgi:hypothetical protein